MVTADVNKALNIFDELIQINGKLTPLNETKTFITIQINIKFLKTYANHISNEIFVLNNSSTKLTTKFCEIPSIQNVFKNQKKSCENTTIIIQVSY